MEPLKPLNSSTYKKFLEDTYLFKLSDCILQQIKTDDKDPLSLFITFDKTIFHPQGGGQPSDSGDIISETERYPILELSYDNERENILHKIRIKDENDLKNFDIGRKFSLEINESRRRTNARLHSAGHLLDTCVKSLGIDWVPGKGFHFEDGPYVEYVGKILNDEKLKDVLTEKCNFFIKNTEEENKAITKFYEYDEACKILKVPDFLAKDKPIRYVRLFDGDEGCPCGGTHVKHVRDIGGMKVVRIAKKGKNLRVSYQLN